MTPLTVWAFWLLVGGVVGYLFGLAVSTAEWMQQAAQETHLMAEEMHVTSAPKPLDKAAVRRKQLERIRTSWAIPVILLLVVCAGAFLSFRLTEKENQQNKCASATLTQFLDAVNDRQGRAKDLNDATHQLFVTQQEMLVTLGNPASSQAVKTLAYLKYLTKLTTYNNAYTTFQVAQDKHPYPSAEHVQGCYK